MTEWPFRCSDMARDRTDPPLGTAPQTTRWLLIEHPTPWRVNAVAGSELLGTMRQTLTRLPPLTRTLLIRRHGRPRGSGAHRRHWAVVDTGGAVQWGSWITAADLAAAVDLVHSPEPIVGLPEPLLLVCTHGIHDQCCAVRGRPVAAALAETYPDLTWECSHLGGDRFAANLLALPSGALYGNLDAGSAEHVVADHLRGRVSREHLRGLAAHPPLVQVALGAVHDQLPDVDPYALLPRPVAALGPSRWSVEIQLPGPDRAVVVVRTGQRPAAVLTCRAPRETSAVDYVVESVALPTSAGPRAPV